jgi:hypothetical protein
MFKLSDQVERKFIESFDVDDWEIDTDSDWQPISSIHKTIEYEVWEIVTENGAKILCADTHIVFDQNFNEIFVKDCVPDSTLIMTRLGPSKVKSVEQLLIKKENMFDITVCSDDHRLWTGDILSHNSTTTCGFILWYILFNSEKVVALLANKGETAREILGKIQLAYQHLPKWLQQGVVEWNKGSFVLENNSRVIASATSSDNIRGFSINLLFIDEAAFIENWDAFFTSVYPTISSGLSTKVVLVSTPNGLNHFYQIWHNAHEGKNGYKPIKVLWNDVPGRDQKWKNDTLASMNFDTEKFAQEYEVEFLGSSGTLIAGWKLKELVPQRPIQQKEGLTLYKHPVQHHVYTCIVDVSRGKGLDYSAFSIIDVTSMPYEQVCVYRNNMVTPIDYASIVFQVAKSYNNAATLVEINDIGEQVSTSLHYDFEYDNILFTESAGRLGKRITTGFGSNIDRGIMTTKIVKSVGCSILKLLIEQNQLVVNDFNTISELATFSKKGASYQAEPGKHDDMVMGLVLFAWLSDQSYFKDITDINTLARLREKSEEDVINDMLPFGFVDYGGSLEDIIDQRPMRTWMSDEVENEFL